MKTNLLLTALLFLAGFAYGQYKSVLDEDFSDNRNNWFTGDSEIFSASIEGGNYVLNHKRTMAGYDVYESYFLDPERPYSIHARMKQVSGINNNGYGILFGMKDVDNTYTFLVTSNGYWKINELDQGKFSDIAPWKSHESVKGMNKWNELKIEYKHGWAYFFVNDQQVFMTRAIPFKGHNLGFNLNKNMKVFVDKFEVRQDGNIIKIAPGYTGGEIKIEKLGTNINSIYTDKSPVVSADGLRLYIARQDHPENLGEEKKDDIWYATRRPGEDFSVMKLMEKPLNNEGHNGVISVLPDNNTLFVTNTYNSDGTEKGSGVSICKRTKSGWEVPKQLEIEDYYNDNQYAEYWLTSNQKVLLMAIQRKDSYGDQDLYYSKRREDGTWTAPKNCGKTLNTLGSENSPFLAADGKTLFFSSSGMPGYGSNDIYVSKRLDDSWEHWSEPLNLGPKINSKNWDAYFRIDASGEQAYMVTNINTLGMDDVQRVVLSEKAKPEPVILVKGKVFDSKTKDPIGTSIHIQDLRSGEEVGLANSDPATGKYQIVLPFGKQYSFQAKAKQHFGTSENLDTRSITAYAELTRDLSLTPIRTGETIRLENIFFDPGKAFLKNESYVELNRLLEMMSDNPGVRIRLGGHTELGIHKENLQELSQKRADACKNYLISKGIAPARLESKGYGDSQPKSMGKTAEDKALNRRVEFTIL